MPSARAHARLPNVGADRTRRSLAPARRPSRNPVGCVPRVAALEAANAIGRLPAFATIVDALTIERARPAGACALSGQRARRLPL